MSYRGSLQQCITRLGEMFATGQYKFLSILSHPAAKYYNIATDEDLDNPAYKPETGDVRLVLRCTVRELRALMKHPQQSMIEDLLKNAPPSDQ